MNNYDPKLMAYIRFADNLLQVTFENYEHAIRALIGIENITSNFIAKWGNPILEKISIEKWVIDDYSNFDALTMGYSRYSAKHKLEVIQKKYGCRYGNMSDRITDRMNKKLEKIYRNHGQC